MVVFALYPLGETRVQREAEALVKHGYEVDVICLREPGSLPVDQYKGVTIYREKFQFSTGWLKSGLWDKLYSYIFFFITAAFRLTRLHLENHYTTIQVHNMPDFLVFCALIPKLLGTAILLDSHDLMPEFYGGRYGKRKSISALIILLQEKLSCRFADHVITVTEQWRQKLIRRGVSETKCSVVMNVADENIFHPLPQSPNQLFQKENFRLIYHGAFVKRNGLDLAVQAINRVRRDIPGIHLTLIGGGEEKQNLLHLVEELGLDRQVSFKDLRPAEELPEIIRSCDIGIAPIRNDVFTEYALPTKLMEYAAMGIPAIAGGTPVNREYFSNTNTEFFEPGNAEDLARCILMLYQNPDRLKELSLKSQNFNQRYNWPKISAEYVSLVNRLGGVEPGIDIGNQ
jgi:glycosyltransferase involved in cell wall biosynthesis